MLFLHAILMTLSTMFIYSNGTVLKDTNTHPPHMVEITKPTQDEKFFLSKGVNVIPVHWYAFVSNNDIFLLFLIHLKESCWLHS
jgi:hypothetical protein